MHPHCPWKGDQTTALSPHESSLHNAEKRQEHIISGFAKNRWMLRPSTAFATCIAVVPGMVTWGSGLWWKVLGEPCENGRQSAAACSQTWVWQIQSSLSLPSENYCFPRDFRWQNMMMMARVLIFLLFYYFFKHNIRRFYFSVPEENKKLQDESYLKKNLFRSLRQSLFCESSFVFEALVLLIESSRSCFSSLWFTARWSPGGSAPQTGFN